MSEDMLVQHCSPTLAGIKTGNMFNCKFADDTEMKNCVRCRNRVLVKKGLRILPLRFQHNCVLVYVYRPQKLSSDLQHDTAYKILKSAAMKQIDRNGVFPN